MKEPATYPASVWNGLSDNPSRTSRNDDIPPDSRDWDRVVAEVIATQEQLTSVGGTADDSMHWQGTYNASTAYVVGDVVYNSSDFIFYVAVADDTGNTPGGPGAVGIWEAISMPITGLPQITGILMPASGNYVLGSDGSEASWEEIGQALAAVYPAVGQNQFITVLTQNATVGSGNFYHGTPVTILRQQGVKVTGDLATGNGITTNITALGAVTGSAWNGLTFTVAETENAADPIVVTYDSGNAVYTAAIDDTAVTTVQDIVDAWNAAQDDIVLTYGALDEYDPATYTPAQLTLVLAPDGVDEDITAAASTTDSANLMLATAVGLCYNPFSETVLDPLDPVVIQTDGVMTFTANQAGNTFNSATLGSGNLLTPGIPHYVGADDLMCGLGATVNTSYVVPLGTPISTTEFKLRLGLPTVGLVLPGA